MKKQGQSFWGLALLLTLGASMDAQSVYWGNTGSIDGEIMKVAK